MNTKSFLSQICCQTCSKVSGFAENLFSGNSWSPQEVFRGRTDPGINRIFRSTLLNKKILRRPKDQSSSTWFQFPHCFIFPMLFLLTDLFVILDFYYSYKSSTINQRFLSREATLAMLSANHCKAAEADNYSKITCLALIKLCLRPQPNPIRHAKTKLNLTWADN